MELANASGDRYAGTSDSPRFLSSNLQGTEMKQDTSDATLTPDLQGRIARVGSQLSTSLTAVTAALPGAPHGPQSLADLLGVDKVLTSRLLKALRTKDPLAVVYHIPGPDPVRRVLRGCRRKGVDPGLLQSALDAIVEFETLIRREAGDRASLSLFISAWLPEARREFELRSKQAAFRALSQLKGAMAESALSTVLLHPAGDGKHIDVVWVFGLLGLQRLRPGGSVKFATRRMAPVDAPRQPVNLDGTPIQDLSDARVDEFCEAPANLDVERVGEVMHYRLADNGYGPGSAADLVLVEVNYTEMPRFVPVEGRKGNVFAEVGTPVKRLLFDVFVHRDIYPHAEPQLLMYDTALDGAADINDPSRDVDRLDLMESIQNLGWGVDKARDARIPDYVDLLNHVFDRVAWEGDRFRGYRCAIDYPMYGSQIAMAFDPPVAPG